MYVPATWILAIMAAYERGGGRCSSNIDHSLHGLQAPAAVVYRGCMSCLKELVLEFSEGEEELYANRYLVDNVTLY